MLLKEGRGQIPGLVNREGVRCLHLSARRAVSTATEELPPDRRARTGHPRRAPARPGFHPDRSDRFPNGRVIFTRSESGAPPAEPTSLEGLIVL